MGKFFKSFFGRVGHEGWWGEGQLAFWSVKPSWHFQQVNQNPKAIIIKIRLDHKNSKPQKPIK